MLKSKVKIRWVMLIAAIIYFGAQSYSIQKLSFNGDESMFASYGFTILKFQGNKDVVFYESKLPITALNGIPRIIEQILHPGLKKADWGDEDYRRGRYISLIASLLLGLLIFQWAKELYGETAGLCSYIFYLLCPNFLAHGIFVGTDVYAALFLTASFYFLWKYQNVYKLKYFLLFSVSVALAEISKFSMIFLYLLIPLLITVRYFFKIDRDKKSHAPLLLLAIFVLINLFVISAAHLFYQMFLPLNDYHFRSSAFLQLQKIFGFLPVPLPSSYVRSMDLVMYFDSIGNATAESISNETYILGKYSPFGLWYFYFVTIFYKTPISTLLIWLCSIVLTFKNFSKSSFLRNEFYLLLPVVFYLIYLDFFYTTQLGIRHIIIIFPALLVLSGRFYSSIIAKRKMWVIYVLMLYQFVSVASYFPHFLPYTNEFILNKKMAYRKLGDSNLNYYEGQNYMYEYLEKHKDVIFQPDSIVSGKVLIDANRVLGLNVARPVYSKKFIWAKDLVPVDHIHSQYLIYNITPKEADSLRSIYAENIKNRKY